MGTRKIITGFTLVEMLIVVLLMGVLAAIAIPAASMAAKSRKVNACDSNISLINAQIEMYKLANKQYPAQLSDVTGDADYFPDGVPLCPFETTYVLGGNNRITLHNH